MEKSMWLGRLREAEARRRKEAGAKVAQEPVTASLAGNAAKTETNLKPCRYSAGAMNRAGD